MDTQTDIRDAADTLSPNWDGERLFPAEQGNIMKRHHALTPFPAEVCESVKQRDGGPVFPAQSRTGDPDSPSLRLFG